MKLHLMLAFACAALAPFVVNAQGAPAKAKAKPDQIKIQYVPPKDPAHATIYTRLQNLEFLERVQQFLSPVKLPGPLLFKTEGCDGEVNAWFEDNAITICYEYIDEMWKLAPETTTPAGVTRLDALIGPIFDTVLHEFGHAIFEILSLPVLGREEDAADQISAYVQLQLGKETARRLIGGTAYAYYVEATGELSKEMLEARKARMQRFADEHGTPAQRLFNLLCIAYGADPKTFEDVVKKGYLPQDRADGCDFEYKQAAHAYKTLVAPHIDRERAKRVLDQTWLPPATMKVKRRPSPPPKG